MHDDRARTLVGQIAMLRRSSTQHCFKRRG